MTSLALLVIRTVFRIALRRRSDLALENLALRQQLAMYERTRPSPRSRTTDRLFWTAISGLLPSWRSALVVVRPETVVQWHRKGFRLFWSWKSRRGGRPATHTKIADLVHRMAGANPTWGAPRIRAELERLGIQLAESTVDRLMPRRGRRPPSQTWRTFLENHLASTVGIDFFVIPTVSFRLLFGFVVLAHDRRRILHLNVTAHPTAEWTGQQLVEAFPWQRLPRFLLRDRDSVYGHDFQKRVRGLRLHEILTAARSPWQNPYCERVIGSIRRDLLDRVIVLDEDHARRLLLAYQAHYNADRCHSALARDSPDGRPVQAAVPGDQIVEFPRLGGLHHRYERHPALPFAA